MCENNQTLYESKLPHWHWTADAKGSDDTSPSKLAVNAEMVKLSGFCYLVSEGHPACITSYYNPFKVIKKATG